MTTKSIYAIFDRRIDNQSGPTEKIANFIFKHHPIKHIFLRYVFI